MSVHIWGSQKGVSLSGFKPAPTSWAGPDPLCVLEFQNRNNLDSCLTSWNLDCQHSKCLLFPCTSFLGRLVSALFKSIYGVSILERSLFWRKVGSSSDAYYCKNGHLFAADRCKHRHTISGHGMNALQCLKGKHMWIQARKVQQKKPQKRFAC